MIVPAAVPADPYCHSLRSTQESGKCKAELLSSTVSDGYPPGMTNDKSGRARARPQLSQTSRFPHSATYQDPSWIANTIEQLDAAGRLVAPSEADSRLN